jgi:alkanesulfonate monooxygenase SsuD/methylene tetrahydromethanopterin reductase-like flavin-dependent oxidoreductase (luciferase family)
MKFGIWDHVDRSGLAIGAQFEARLVLAQEYERAGFRAYHVAEHHGTPFGLAPSPGIFLSAIAQRTSTLRFGPLVYLLPLYHPLRLYEEICMLDQLSGGRLELGIGRGISPHELRLYGLDPEEAPDRFREALEVLMAAFQSDTLSYEGKYYSFKDVPLHLKPVQSPHPPLWYGALKPDTADWTARRGMNLVCGNGPAAEIRAVTDHYRTVRRAQPAGTAGEPLLGMQRQLVVADTDEEAQCIARRAFGVFRDNFTWLWKRNGDPLADMLLPEDFGAVERHGEALAGSPATVRRVLAAQAREAGVNYLVCRFAFGDLSLAEMTRSVRLFATEVMPALRDLPEPEAGPPEQPRLRGDTR